MYGRQQAEGAAAAVAKNKPKQLNQKKIKRESL
jgi:hypothetical protein